MAWSIGPRAKEAAGEDLDLYTDMLGARKLVVFATRTGKVLALDTEKGRVVWGRYFEGISFQQIESLRASLIKFPPVIALIGKQDHDEVLSLLNIDGKPYSLLSIFSYRILRLSTDSMSLPVKTMKGKGYLLLLPPFARFKLS